LPSSAALIPIIQIVSFECHLFVLKKVEDFYVLETVDIITFPTTHKALQDNGIKKLISCLDKAKMEGILDNKKGEEKVDIRAMVWPPKEEHGENAVEEKNTGEENDGDEDEGEEDLARVQS
ncbi:hypothetical protein CU098_002480, partial [Rhizopus stolonifer]